MRISDGSSDVCASDLPDPMAEVWPDAARFVSVGYAVTEQILQDNIGFSNAGIRKMTEYVFGDVSLMGSDDPGHRKFRALVPPAFTRPGLDLWRGFVRPRLDHLIEGFQSSGALRVGTHCVCTGLSR